MSDGSLYSWTFFRGEESVRSTVLCTRGLPKKALVAGLIAIMRGVPFARSNVKHVQTTKLRAAKRFPSKI